MSSYLVISYSISETFNGSSGGSVEARQLSELEKVLANLIDVYHNYSFSSTLGSEVNASRQMNGLGSGDEVFSASDSGGLGDSEITSNNPPLHRDDIDSMLIMYFRKNRYFEEPNRRRHR